MFMVLALFSNKLLAQAPPLNWYSSVDASAPEAEIWGTCGDKDGNFFVTGRILDTTTFGTVVLNTFGGGSNFYLVKYNASGSVVWGKTFNTPNSSAIGYSVCTDNNGDVIVSGSYNSPTITIDTTVLTNVSNGSLPDIFLVKYDTDGNILWVHGEGGDKSDGVSKVATDSTGNIFLAFESSSSSITIGSQTLITKNDPFSSLNDIYLVKYDSNGNAQWARNDGGTGDDRVRGFSVNKNGNLYLTGNINTFGASITYSFTPVTLSNISSNDFYVTKYNTLGNVEWVRNTGNAIGYDINADNNGNVAITGDFSGSTLIIAGVSISKTNPNRQVFTAKLNDAGTVQWLKTENGIGGSSQGANVRIDADGNILVGAMFNGTSITVDTTVFTVAGSTDIILFKYEPTGTVLWSNAIQSIGFDRLNSIAINAEGDELISGIFAGAILSFANSSLFNTPASGTFDMFFISFSGDLSTVWTGHNSADWNSPFNWEPQQVPTEFDNVKIPAGRPYNPIIYGGVAANCKKLQVNDGAILRMNGGTLYIHGKVTATNSTAFQFLGGGVHLLHGNTFPEDMIFNNLTIRNVNDVDADNNYTFEGFTVVFGNFTVSGTSAKPLLPNIILGESDNFFIYKNFNMSSGIIGLPDNAPLLSDLKKMPQLIFEGYPSTQTITISNQSALVESEVKGNIRISNPNARFTLPNTELVLFNLILSADMDLAGKKLNILGKIVYDNLGPNPFKITNSVPSKGAVYIGNAPAFRYDSLDLEINIDKLQTLECNILGNSSNTVLKSSLSVDKLKVIGYLDLNGKNLTVGSVNRNTGRLLVDSLGTTLPEGTLFLYGNSSNPNYELTAKSLNNLVVNNPLGVTLKNSTSFSIGTPSWSNMQLFGTAKLTSGQFDLKGSIITLSKSAMSTTVNKGKIVETPLNTFVSSTSAGLGPAITIDTTVTTSINKRNYGGLGFVITSNVPLNQLTIVRTPLLNIGNAGGFSIARTYEIYNQGAGAGMNAAIEIKYDESELSPINEIDLGIFCRSTEDSAGVWNFIPCSVFTSENYVRSNIPITALDYSTSLGGFTEYTLASIVDPLRQIVTVTGNTAVATTYPNPFTDKFRLFINAIADENASLTISDVSGKQLSDQSIELKSGSNSFEIEALKEFPSGIYFLKVMSSQTSLTLKVIKQ